MTMGPPLHADLRQQILNYLIDNKGRVCSLAFGTVERETLG